MKHLKLGGLNTLRTPVSLKKGVHFLQIKGHFIVYSNLLGEHVPPVPPVTMSMGNWIL